MKGSAFEKLIVERNAEYKSQKLACIGRYGVQAARMKDDWIIMSSLPDFEGTLQGGRQIIFDAKVCSQASMPLDQYRWETRAARARQLRHMYERSAFGAVCFFLIHWPARQLKTKSEPAITFRFPVSVYSAFWLSFEAGEVRTLSRNDCENHGVVVSWNAFGRGTKPRPDFLESIECGVGD